MMNVNTTFQHRVEPWLLQCFGEAIAADKDERNHRFLEESLELVQSTGCTRSEAHQLVDYVFGRSVGEPKQETGGVMVTLAALCRAQGLNMHEAGEVELQRISAPAMVEKIRAKQAAKPKHSPLPESAALTQPEGSLTDAEILHLWDTHVGEPTATRPLDPNDKLQFARAVLHRAAAAPPRAPQPAGDDKAVTAERERCTWIVESLATLMESGAGELEPGGRLRQAAANIRRGATPTQPTAPQPERAAEAAGEVRTMNGVPWSGFEAHFLAIHDAMCRANLVSGGSVGGSYKGWTADGRAVTHRFHVSGYERTGPTVERERAMLAAAPTTEQERGPV